MYKYGVLLIEISTEELPIDNFRKLGEDFSNYFLYEFKKNLFFCSDYSYYVTLRKISCVFRNFNFYQNINDKNKIFYGPEININEEINFFKNPLLGWIKKFNFDYKKVKYFIINKKRKFFINRKNNKKDIIFFIKNIFSNVLFKLIKNRKVMRWGIKNFVFIRPVTNIVVMFNKKILDVNFFDIKSNNVILGHRFLKKKRIVLDHAKNYEYFLFKYGKVIVDFDKRKQRIINLLNNISFKNNFSFNYNNNYLNKITYMVDWPNVLICKFKKKFLFLPKELLIFIIESYYGFVVFNINNNLLNYFIIISNLKFDLLNFNIVKKNYELVIESKLSDAFFLFKKDRKYSLISYLPKLKNIVFYNKLGNLFDKIRRILYLSNKISNYLFIKINRYLLNISILLIKCDLSTSLYKEYTNLKGIIGMFYALIDYKFSRLSLIIKEHYYPRYSGDYIPTNKYSSIISLSDKIDNLTGILILNNFSCLKSSNDPYGLRKISLLILNIILVNNYYIDLYNLLKFNINLFKKKISEKNIILILKFIFKRSTKIFLNLGYNKKFINSVICLNIFNLLDIKLRLEVVWKIRYSKNFLCLVNLCKRIKNILLKNKYFKFDIIIKKEFFFLKEEINLYKYILFLEKKNISCFLKHKYINLINYFFMSIEKVEKFFLNVRLDIKDINVKNNRLNLLNRLNLIFLKFIDFNKLI